jgi:single-strand DNA-binding protein
MAGLLRFPNINNLTISGRLARDVDVKHTANNQTIATFVIAVSHYYRDESGEFKEQASFVDCVAFGETAKKCIKDLKKGFPVMIEGYIKTRSYVDQNQINRKVTEIVVNKAYPLERADREDGHHQYNGGQQSDYQSQNHTKSQQPSTPPQDNDDFESYDSLPVNSTVNDVPF